MSKIRVALTGVGNCASALVQGVKYYAKAEKEEQALGLRHLYLGGYHPRDIEFVCAFDVEARKIGKDRRCAPTRSPGAERPNPRRSRLTSERNN